MGARKYSVNSGLSSLAASTTKVAVQLATGAAVTNTVHAFDVTFDSTATGSGAIGVRVQLVRTTGASSTGGAAATPAPWTKGQMAALTTARANDTTDGASPTLIKSWLISPTAGVVYQFPLGRDMDMLPSDFLEVRLVSQAGFTTCNYEVNVDLEE